MLPRLATITRAVIDQPLAAKAIKASSDCMGMGVAARKAARNIPESAEISDHIGPR
jgi:hypothetical protein